MRWGLDSFSGDFEGVDDYLTVCDSSIFIDFFGGSDLGLQWTTNRWMDGCLFVFNRAGFVEMKRRENGRRGGVRATCSVGCV